MPPGLTEQPEIEPIAEFYWEAFQDLSTARSVGMGLGPIPFVAYAEFARVRGLGIDEFEFLCGVVGELDGEFLRLNQPKTES